MVVVVLAAVRRFSMNRRTQTKRWMRSFLGVAASSTDSIAGAGERPRLSAHRLALNVAALVHLAAGVRDRIHLQRLRK